MNKRHPSGLHGAGPRRDANYCGPCALAAITGRSPDTWDDRSMTGHELEDALRADGLELTIGAVDSFPMLRLLGAFCYPLFHKDTEWPTPNGGVYSVTVVHAEDTPIDDRELHVVAVGVRLYTSGLVHRWVVDNKHRWPMAFSSMRRDLSNSVVVGWVYVKKI